MFRCVLLSLALAMPLIAQAQQVPRNFPQNALRGELLVTSSQEAMLNGKPTQLAPGMRIKGGNNLLVMSGAILGQKLIVNYTLDSYGLVKDVWLLRQDEVARKPWPKTPAEAARWSFDPIAQTWTKP